MKKKICRESGCNCLINSTETYCEKHIKDRPAPFAKAVRSNEGLYNTSQWRKLRKKILTEQPFCSKCGNDINLQVHHIIAPRGDETLFYHEVNLMVVCATCHKLLTNKEINSRKAY